MYFFIVVACFGSLLYLYLQHRIKKKKEKEREEEEYEKSRLEKIEFKVCMEDGSIEHHRMSLGRALNEFPIMMPGGFRKAFSKEPFGVPDDIKNVISLMDRGESIRKIRKKIRKGEIEWWGPK